MCFCFVFGCHVERTFVKTLFFETHFIFRSHSTIRVQYHYITSVASICGESWRTSLSWLVVVHCGCWHIRRVHRDRAFGFAALRKGNMGVPGNLCACDAPTNLVHCLRVALGLHDGKRAEPRPQLHRLRVLDVDEVDLLTTNSVHHHTQGSTDPSF